MFTNRKGRFENKQSRRGDVEGGTIVVSNAAGNVRHMAMTAGSTASVCTPWQGTSAGSFERRGR